MSHVSEPRPTLARPDALRVNVIGKSNRVGLSRDLDLIAHALKSAGCEVRFTLIDDQDAHRRRSALVQMKTRLLRGWRRRRRDGSAAQADVNVMLEHVWLQYLDAAKLNIALPNPEWFDRHDQRFLRDVDVVWAKTGYTQGIFTDRGAATNYVGFDSEDRLLPDVERTRTYFHLAGKSTMKGTDRLLALWARHPEWPQLIVVQHKDVKPPFAGAANIDVRVGYLSDEELRRLQNESVFHLCTSLTEGWGHYIVEALSVGAVTVTLDAAPMNELVTRERGLLVACRPFGEQRLATTHHFDEVSLEAAIERTRAMSDQESRALGAKAREWFLQNKAGFPARVQAALRAAMSEQTLQLCTPEPST